MSNPIADQLRKIADEIDKLPEYSAGAPVPLPVPEGMVAVYPTGVRGAGKVRYYPDPKPMAAERPFGLNLWGYHTVLTEMRDAGGVPYARQILGPYQINSVPCNGIEDYANAVDRLEHPADWTSQADLDNAAKLAARDQGAVWVSGDATVTGPIDVPIPDEE